MFDMNVEIIVVLGWQRSNNRCTGTELPHDLHSACMPCLVNSDNVPWQAHQSGASSLHRFRIRRFSRNLDGEVLCEMSKVSAVAFYLVCVALGEFLTGKAMMITIALSLHLDSEFYYLLSWVDSLL